MNHIVVFMSSWCEIEFSGDCDNLVIDTSKWPECSDDSRNDSALNESRGAFDDTADSDRNPFPSK